MSILIFGQTIGGAIWLSAAEATFSSGLTESLSKYAPGVSPKAVVIAGATHFRHAVPQDAVRGVILAYNAAVSHVFYVSTGAAAACFAFSWGMGWKSVKKAKSVAPEA